MASVQSICRRAACLLSVAAALWISFALAQTTVRGQEIPINLDEAKVKPYTLPDPLVMSDGRKVATREAWVTERRPELIRILEDQVYGKVPQPPQPIRTTLHVRSEDSAALGGKAIRREITIAFTEKPDGPRMDLLLYLPKVSGAASSSGIPGVEL